MSNVNANINISINSQQALGQLRALQNQISTFNQSIVAGNVAAAQAQRDMTRNLTAQINATKGFTTSIANVETSVSRLGRAIDKNKLSLQEYFRYGIAASGAMGKGMKEHAEIMSLAGERVKRLQTQYIALEQAHNGYTRSLAVRPTQLFNADSAIAIQRQQIFNKLLGDGSTALVNWGKNTQWAGRQLMVGFTVPLTIFGGVAGKIFMDLEKQVVQFKRVYGDLQTPTSERNAMVEEVKALAKEFTKYGIAVSDTVALAAKAAATGAQGADLLSATTEATRLATLGQIDYQQALDATISLQTAFGISSKNLAEATDFLNAVENQTVTSLDDITQAIPLVAPVIKGLGGDVKDLAIFMTAMREGGISANEGANALKSGLASLINPTRGARDQLEKVGISIDSILSRNKGDLRGLVSEFGEALGTLGKFERQQTLAKMFGKYQFARMGALFANISKEGSQAARVMDLTAMSAKELGQIAEGELGQLEQSVGVKFTAAVEKLKLAIAPIGEAFLKIATPIIDFAAKIADAFNNLPDAAKTFITWGTAIGGVLVPTIIMLVGLLGNFAGNMLKIGAAIGRLMGKTNGLSSGLEYLTMEELDAMAAAASLEGQTNTLTGALNVQRTAVNRLASAYGNYTRAAGAAATNIPQGFGGPARKMARGGMVGGTGNKDSEPALLMPGEFVINAEASKKFAPLLAAINNGQYGMYAEGRVSAGGRSVSMDFRTDSQRAAVQRRMNAAADQGEDVLDELVRILTSFSGTVEDIGQIDRMLTESTDTRIKQLAKTERRWSTTDPRVSARTQGFRESGVWQPEVSAIQQAMPGLRESKMGALTQYDASHIRQTLDAAGNKIFNMEDLQSEIGALNNYYNRGAEIAKRFNMTTESIGDEARLVLNGVERQAPLSQIIAESMGRSDVSAQDVATTLHNISQGLAPADEKSKAIVLALADLEAQLAADAAKLHYGITDSREALVRAANDELKTKTAIGTPIGGGYRADAYGIAERSRAERNFEPPNYAEALNEGDAVSAATRVGEVVGETLGETTVQSAGDVVERIINDPRNSPHPAVPPAATQDGTKYGTDFAQSAAAAMKKAGQRTDSTLTPFGVAKDIEREKEARVEAAKRKAIEAQTNRELQKRVMILQRQGVPAQAALRIAKEELATEKELLRTEQQRDMVGGQSDRAAARRARGAYPSSPQGPTSAGVQRRRPGGMVVPDIGKEASSLKGGMRKFGDSLMRGSAKMTGAMFALDGLVFGMSMMDNQLGEMAQQLMPAVFGIQGIAMMLPLLKSPMGIAIAAFAAVGIGLWKVNSNMEELRDNGRKMSEAMVNTTKSLEDTAAFYNRTLVTQKEAAKSLGTDTESLTKGQEYLKTEGGSRMAQGFSMSMQTMGKDAATKQFAAKLGSMIMQGAASPKEARGIADALETELGIKGLSASIKGKLTKIVGKDGKDIQKNPITVGVKLQVQNENFISGIQSQLADLQSAGQFTGGGEVLSSALAPFGGQALAAALQSSTADIPLLSGIGRNIRSFFDPQFAALTSGAYMYGTAVSAVAKDGYGVLNAATARYKKLQKEANKEQDPKKKKELLANLREERKGLKELEKGMQDLREKSAETFSTMDNGFKVEALKGLEDSLNTQFAEGTPEGMALQSILGDTSDIDRNLQFNIKTMLATGELSPTVVAGFLNQFENNEDATATLNMLLESRSMDDAEQKMLDILSIKNDELRKKAVLVLETESNIKGGKDDVLGNMDIYAGTPLAKTAAEDKTASINAAKERMKATQEALTDWEEQNPPPKPSEENASTIAAVRKELAEREAWQEVQYEAGQRGAVGREGTPEEIERWITSRKEYVDATNDVAEARERLSELEKEAAGDSAEYNAWLEKQSALQKEADAAVKAYNDSIADTTDIMTGLQRISAEKLYGTPEERAQTITDFIVMKDKLQELSGQKLSFDTDGKSLKEIEDMEFIYSKLAKAPKKLLRKIDVDAAAAQADVDVFKIKWNELENQKDVEKALGLNTKQFENALELAGLDYAAFDALPNIQKSLVMTYTTAYFDFKKQYDDASKLANDRAKVNADGYATTGAADWGSSAKQADVASVGMVQSEQAAQDAALDYNTGGTEEDGDKDTNGTGSSGGSDGGGGGGSNPAEDLRKSIMDRMKLYLNMTQLIKKVKAGKKGFTKELLDNTKYNNSLADKLRDMNLSETMVAEILSKGPEDAQKIIDKFGKKGLQEQNRKMLAGIRGEQVSGFVGQRKVAQNQKGAMAKLQKDGSFTQAEIVEIVSDEAQAEVLASLKRGSKGWVEYINKLKAAKKAAEDFAEAQDPIGYQLEAQTAMFDSLSGVMDAAFESQFNAIDRNHRESIDSYEDQIKAKEKEIEAIEEEIDAIEKLNDADERRIDTLQRNKEMISRQIEQLERANELDQRRIDDLQREDEIRNRVADSIQHELELMSDRENEIKKAYEDRRNALEDVIKLNDHLLNQQRSQLDMARALSEGDVYAAAQAQQAMQQQQVQYAADQVRAGLDQAEEDAVGDLRTSGGMTREQAEQRLNDIRDQSYQTSLLIRDIEDQIYNRNQQMIPLKDQQYQIDLQIRDIEDVIYQRELDIQAIQLSRLEPREQELDALNKSLEAETDLVEKEKESVVVGGLKHQQWQDTKQQINDAFAQQAAIHDLMRTSMLPGVQKYAKTWVQVGKAIEAAYSAQKTGNFDYDLNLDTSDIPTMPKIELPNMTDINWQEEMDNLLSSLENYTAAASGMYMGGRVKGFAAGAIVGSGGGDKVPAMLSPGEYVIRKSMVDKYGLPLLESINQGSFSMPKYGGFGTVNSNVSGGGTSKTTTVAPVYNTYSVHVNASTNASPDDIANTVINKIRSIDSMSVRRINGY